MRASNLFLAPGAVLPCYAPAHHDCLAKMAKFVYKITRPISGKLSTTNYLNKTLLSQSHLTTENNLKVEKNISFRKQVQLFLSDRNAWVTQRQTYQKTRKQ